MRILMNIENANFTIVNDTGEKVLGYELASVTLNIDPPGLMALAEEFQMAMEAKGEEAGAMVRSLMEAAANTTKQ